MSITIGTHPNNLATWILGHVEELQEPLRRVAGEVRFVRYDDGRRTTGLLVEGAIDVGATGTTPPIVAQAEQLDVVYLAVSEPHPDPGGIVVPRESPIRTLADLRGRSIAFTVGSWQTHALAVAVDRAGLAWDDVTVVDVPATAQGRDFLGAGTDSWLVVDPAYRQLADLTEVRVVAATEELVRNRSVFFGNGAWVRDHPAEATAFVDAVVAAEEWGATHLDEVAELLSRSSRGGTAQVWGPALTGRHWGVHAVDEEFLAEQQHAADLLYRFGVTPQAIVVVAAVAAR
ncbi:sulfonate transport system substrate-binding protein [Micromonospora pallida]|uniref:Sulfonate transport system substrate-binding protein n=1 Tax=Micromonospora pallida TaxID=145854 RepID=A0A1C6S0Q9_9ACTN|nr:ABC transporter substrate-binding protein [Micromonospora pallida]SCL22899.1 sulfonate transport system substrate-binding protein [Micromonospora pallida]